MPNPSPTPRPIVVGLGELLWDLFPRGKQLGGAPANFAYITALLGDFGIIASRIGDDRLGQEALWHLESSGLDVSRIQRDPLHPTGTVKVEVDTKGQPEYHIIENVAWDYMEFSEDWISLARPLTPSAGLWPNEIRYRAAAHSSPPFQSSPSESST
jgi:fructokinase